MLRAARDLHDEAIQRHRHRTCWLRLARGRWLAGWDVASRCRNEGGKPYEYRMLEYLTDVPAKLRGAQVQVEATAWKLC